jgi:hypothetical protein
VVWAGLQSKSLIGELKSRDVDVLNWYQPVLTRRTRGNPIDENSPLMVATRRAARHGAGADESSKSALYMCFELVPTSINSKNTGMRVWMWLGLLLFPTADCGAA